MAYLSFEISDLAIKPKRAGGLGTKLGTYKANIDASARAQLIQ
jgi:hypothetical protein